MQMYSKATGVLAVEVARERHLKTHNDWRNITMGSVCPLNILTRNQTWNGSAIKGISGKPLMQIQVKVNGVQLVDTESRPLKI